MSSFLLLDVDRDGRDVVIAGSNGLGGSGNAGCAVSQGLMAGVSGSVSSVIATDVDGDGVDDLAGRWDHGDSGAGSSFSRRP
jgi:hypothetical protein